MVRLARSRERRDHLAALGLRRARMFSWERAARETLDVYRQVAKQPAGAVRVEPAPPLPPRSGVECRSRSAAGQRSNPAAVGSVNMTDVLFGQAYFLRFDPEAVGGAAAVCAAWRAVRGGASCGSAGTTWRLFDAMLAASEAEWADALDLHRPRFAVIYEDSFNYLSKMCLLRMREAAFTMIDAARARGIPTIVAGSDASDHPELYLDRGAGVVVAGEGEMTLGDVLDVLERTAAGRR